MTRLLLAIPLMALSAGCATTQQNAAAGAAAGAALGAALADDDDRLEGAAIGAVAGGVAASTLIGPAAETGRCLYRDSSGRRFIADC